MQIVKELENKDDYFSENVLLKTRLWIPTLIIKLLGKADFIKIGKKGNVVTRFYNKERVITAEKSSVFKQYLYRRRREAREKQKNLDDFFKKANDAISKDMVRMIVPEKGTLENTIKDCKKQLIHYNRMVRHINFIENFGRDFKWTDKRSHPQYFILKRIAAVRPEYGFRCGQLFELLMEQDFDVRQVRFE